MAKATVRGTGWFGPAESKKDHYIENGTSLCGRWGMLWQAECDPWFDEDGYREQFGTKVQDGCCVKCFALRYPGIAAELKAGK